MPAVSVCVAAALGCSPASPPATTAPSPQPAPSAAGAPGGAPAAPEGFVPDLPAAGLPAPEAAPGPTCRVAVHDLGAMEDPGDNLYPIALATDALGGVACWKGPAGVMLRRLSPDGAPAGDAVVGPAFAPGRGVHLGAGGAALVRWGEAEIEVAFLDRATLRQTAARKVARPAAMKSIQASALDDHALVAFGSDERSVTVLRVPAEGEVRTATAPAPRELGVPPDIEAGLWDGARAALVTAANGDAWLTDGTRVEAVAPGQVHPRQGPFVTTAIVKFATGDTRYALLTVPSYPARPAPDPPEGAEEAFRIGCTHGFSADAWSGSHFLFACAAGEEGALRATLYTADCRGRRAPDPPG